jgi:hypothetical protein
MHVSWASYSGVSDFEVRSRELSFPQLLEEEKGFVLSSKTEYQFIQYFIQFAIHSHLTIRKYGQGSRKGTIK